MTRRTDDAVSQPIHQRNTLSLTPHENLEATHLSFAWSFVDWCKAGFYLSRISPKIQFSLPRNRVMAWQDPARPMKMASSMTVMLEQVRRLALLPKVATWKWTSLRQRLQATLHAAIVSKPYRWSWAPIRMATRRQPVHSSLVSPPMQSANA
jgi:hypothetical protein